MSGASAMAAARRRRTGPQESTIGSQSNKQVTIQENIVQEPSNQLTPLQILKLHDTKIKKLEELLQENTNTNTNINTNINTNTRQDNLDEDKILDLMSQKIEGIVSQKINNMNDTIKSILLNIEKLSNVANINEKNLNKTEEFTNELNALKMLVIKNQTLSLEINNDVIKIKDEINDIKSYMNEDNDNNMPNANDLLKSMFNNFNEDDSVFSKINIEDDDVDDKINIDLKNIENLDVTTIENLEEIRKTIVTELAEQKVENINELLEEDKMIESN